MQIEKLSDLIKEKWIDDVHDIDDVNILEEISTQYVSILKSLNHIQSIVPECTDHEGHIEEKKRENTSLNLYVFQRRLRGGIGIQKSGDEESVEIVPESIIKDLSLETGDVFKLEKHAFGINKHRFTKQHHLPKEEVEDYPIVSYDTAIASYDNILKCFTIKGYYNDGKVKSTPQLVINEDDVNRYRVEDGDIIDVAHQPNRSSVRIRWKYNTEEETYIKPRKSSEYKDTHSQKEMIDDSVIENKCIGVIGASSYINRYKEEIEKRNGTLLNTDSEQKEQIENFVLQSDLIVIPIFEVGHIKMDLAKKYAKEYDKPYVILRSNGRSNFIDSVENSLKEQGE
ncbi:DUF2325 domain-containing protein [Staphylococcus capitis]|uniref:DUF2325 domain-containing protein n=1 Tax=Staphylococcus capitis TaxID=29388 RepID=A0ABX1SNW6_STACP|nr:DUF2325 domain-containing protein [Staphylococcus capitis]NMK54001.1 DUF2325 domain-containing protein [Staphylococcus capitis]NMK69306.1 DUF2325 domain-containing protein [Staphylococcus capitis]